MPASHGAMTPVYARAFWQKKDGGMRWIGLALCAWWAATAQAQTAPGGADTVAAIRARGQLVCGVSVNSVGFALPDSRGVMRGMDADVCRALAAVVLGDPEKVRFVPNSAIQRFPMLQSGELDVLVRNTTWTMSRETALGLAAAGVNFYDGQGFLVHANAGITQARQLDGATICTPPGSTTELNLADWARVNNIRVQAVLIENNEELRAAFLAGRCDAMTNDATSLATYRMSQGANANRYLVLPERISKEPLGPLVRKGDWRWFDIVRWTLFAMIGAEEMGVNQGNLPAMMSSPNPDIQRLLGRTGDLGRSMGLDNEWAVRIIRGVGNYGEVYARHIAPLGIERGVNELWTRGGLMYAPPIR